MHKQVRLARRDPWEQELLPTNPNPTSLLHPDPHTALKNLNRDPDELRILFLSVPNPSWSHMPRPELNTPTYWWNERKPSTGAKIPLQRRTRRNPSFIQKVTLSLWGRDLLGKESITHQKQMKIASGH